MNNITYSKNLKHDSEEKKNYNIQSFSKLNRKGLTFGVIERRLFIRKYPTGEKLYIQYPGKESKKENARPWDFRPKLMLSDGSWLGDLSFKDIWDDCYSFKDSNIDMSYIATLFFRIAYMMDTKLVTKEIPFEDLDANGKKVNQGTVKFSWYEYHPKKDVLNGISVPKSCLRNCHLLPYLAYNDLLAQNEDCKYYYRAVHEKKEAWKSDTGRRNTLLTHMSVIAFIEGLLKFTEITDMFQRHKGVAALSPKLWEKTTHGRVIKP